MCQVSQTVPFRYGRIVHPDRDIATRSSVIALTIHTVLKPIYSFEMLVALLDDIVVVGISIGV